MSGLEVRPISGALGAEVHGVDFGRVLDDATIGGIRRALLDHGVVFFRDQHFDAEQHKALARRFGEIFIHPNYAGTQADPELVMIRREPGDTKVVSAFHESDIAQVIGYLAITDLRLALLLNFKSARLDWKRIVR